MEIVRAQLGDLEAVSRLFDQYRVFYQQPSNLEAAIAFLQERFQKNDSVIFLARNQEQSVGFTQLYPSFSSVSMRRVWILNDLFVEQSHRQQGIAKRLIDTAESFARETGAVRIALSTQISNATAQTLYESRGYVRDESFYHYSLSL
ncbi:GNAT family N-acetyltransferase [Leptolyngbya sp. AN03gr2]|uniref:GNAT family N-acetyltransferase n=1 Tax=unclassified Leptolyngbya TaxID=2650499 RepID=UPI003D312310